MINEMTGSTLNRMISTTTKTMAMAVCTTTMSITSRARRRLSLVAHPTPWRRQFPQFE